MKTNTRNIFNVYALIPNEYEKMTFIKTKRPVAVFDNLEEAEELVMAFSKKYESVEFRFIIEKCGLDNGVDKLMQDYLNAIMNSRLAKEGDEK